jgi:hypothetical protein
MLRYTRLSVSLDLVILDNGFALGSDAANVMQEIRSKMDVEREVSAGVIAAAQQGQSAVIAYLQKLADGPREGLIAASQEKTPDLAYAGFFAVQSAVLARVYPTTARRNLAALITLAEARLKKPRFTIYR